MPITILGINTKEEFNNNANKFIFWQEINSKNVYRQTLVPFPTDRIANSNTFAVEFNEDRYDILLVEVEPNKSYELLISLYISKAR